MTTYVLVRANKVVKTIEGLRDLTTAESANGGARYEVTGSSPIYIGGTVTLVNSKVTDIANPDSLTKIEERRIIVKEWLRRADQQPVANWGLKDSDSDTRAKNYWWWLEQIAAASSNDDNLRQDDEWARINKELTWNFAVWYNEHRLSDWQGIRRLLSTFYNTRSNGRWTSQPSSNRPVMPSMWTGLTNYIY